MYNNKLFFIFLIFSISIFLSAYIVFAQAGGGAGGGYAIAGCWDYTNQTNCNAVTGCNWHTTETWGWCEEKGCWSYNNEIECTNITNNCTWSNPGGSGYCYKKGCWDYNSSNCVAGGCNWTSYGYCSKPTCWDYKDTTSCEGNISHPGLSCKWDASFGSCSGPPDKNCWSYYDQIGCQGASCNWQQGSCSEKGCWDYYNSTTCNANNATGCTWGSQGSSGWCKKNETDCWSINVKATCQSNQQCSWQGNEYCQQKSCWGYSNQTACTNTTLHSSLNCVWDSSSYYCKQEDCWNYNNETNCTDTGGTIHPNLTCTWSNSYCSRPSCWNFNTSTGCLNATAHPGVNCRWNSQWNGCEEIGCWNYNNQTSCTDTSDTLSCSWKRSGSCNSIGCWQYNDSASCTNSALHPSLGCTWDSTNLYCYERGCYYLNTSESCSNTSDSLSCTWDSTYNYCSEYGCWNYNNETSCTNTTLTVSNCTWSSGGNYCYKPGCWNYGSNETCSNTTDNLECNWQESSYCQQQGCWDQNDSTSCNSYPDGSCEWYSWGSCSQKGCWEYKNQGDCQSHAADQRCAWDSSYSYCYEYGCWNYNNSAGCGNVTGCKWNSQNNYCEQKGCWNFYDNTNCNNATNSTGINCTWESYNYCYKQGCWDYTNTNNTYCENTTAHPTAANCRWKSSGWCEMGTGNGTNCWNYYDNSTCTNANCTWKQNTWCEEKGPWDYNTNATCVVAGFNWSSSGGWCSESSTVQCWNFDYNQIGCEALSTTCKWQSPYCVKQGCWEFNQTTCSNAPTELNCKWATSSSTGWCEQLGCWNFWNNITSCNVASQVGLNCEWRSTGMCNLPCWNNTLYPNESTCNSNSKCYWQNSTGGSGWCSEKGCWNYNDNTTCTNSTFHPTFNCTWDTTWSYGSCKEAVECWNYNTSSNCLSATGCYWDTPPVSNSSGFCSKKGCWNFWNNQTQCEINNCTYSSQSFCEEKRCWNYADQTNCTNTTLHANLNCRWDNSTWCVEAGCSAHTTENNCKATGYCWWDAGDSTCDEPSATWIQEFESGKTNPGCWIFDNQQTKCGNVTGCYYNLNSSKCTGLESSGIQCGNVTDSSLCNKIPILASCCMWQNNTCQVDTSATKCFDNVAAPPVGATFCEDYNSYTDRATCLKIAADPWYMPCKWDDMGTADTSDDRCAFRSAEKFGGEQKDFGKITSKKDCEFAGGSWSVEYYCEGNRSVPYGRCDKKFGAESVSCDASCWACEYRSNGTRWNSQAEAMAACKASKLGNCNWTSDISSPSGFGYCKMPDSVTYGKGDCSSDCKSCESKSSPKSSCESSPAQCKWVTDTTGATTIGGWCYPKSEKSCSEDCFRCYDEVSCTNYGGGSKGSCNWESSTKMCKPKNFNKEICFDGIDNNGNSNIDCEDADCFSDPFCGGNMLSDCWKYTTQTLCTNKSSEGCVWIIDPWTNKQWCGRNGENCFLWNNNQTSCGNQTSCQWTSVVGGGFCKINETTTQTCFKLTTEAECKANINCKFAKDVSTGTSTCKFNPMTCDSYSQTSCQNTTYCTWTTNPENPTTGNCKSKCLSNIYSTQSACNADANCQWVSGFCNPSQQSGMTMEDCWKYSGNQTGCIAAPACDWKIPISGEFCDINETLNMVVCKQLNQTTCASSPNNETCKWNSDPYGNGWCDLKLFSCGWYNNQTTCVNDPYNYTNRKCAWINQSFGSGPSMPHCEPICFNKTNTSTCNAESSCSWRSGFCESKMSTQMFQGMESPPTPLGSDECPENMAAEQDICGFGLKDDPDTFAFGTMVYSMLNSALCNGQRTKTSDASTVTGTGTNTTKFYWYLDTDGDTSGGCTLYNNASATGYEFFLKYIAKWEDSKLKEVRTSYRCDGGEWILTDIKLTGYQTLMCNEIGGAMIAVGKSELNKFASLYKADKDIRIYVATGNRTTTEINPVDTVGPKYYKKGSADFRFENCMMTGVDMDGDGLKSESDPDCIMFNKMGFIRYEDCFETGVDEDSDGLVDCDDPDCKFAPNCGGKGVNAANYVDTGAPKLLWYDADAFPDAAFIKYDTDEPANGSVTFYYNSSSCSDSNTSGMSRIIVDPALLDADTWNDYKSWHDANIDNLDFNLQKLNYNLTNGTTYYYKIKVCDSVGNCGLSACLNLTTARSSNRRDCPDCDFTIKLTGGSNIRFDFGGSGNYESLSDSTTACGGTGMRSNYSQASLANVRVEGNSSAITFGNASVIGATGSINITEGTTTSGGYSVGYVGLPSDDFDELAGKIRPKTCTIEIPRGTSGTCTQVWKCDDNLANCVDMTSNATLVSSTSTICSWKIPCDFSTYKAGTPSTPSSQAAAGGGGGGGGGGTSGISVIRAKGNVNITINSIAAGKMTNVSIIKTEDVAFRQFNISVVKTVNKIKINILKLPSLPTSQSVSGEAYHYIEITKQNITSTDINKVYIKFAVEKSWMTNNNIDPLTVHLYQWKENNWNALTTSKIDENNEETFYQAETSDFSYFAISGYKEGQAPTGAAIICIESWSCTDWSTACVDNKQTRTCSDSNNCGTTVNKPLESRDCLLTEEFVGAPMNFAYIIIAIIIIIAVIAVIWKQKYKRSI